MTSSTSELHDETVQPPPIMPDVVSAEEYNPWTFSLATIFQLMLLFSVTMAIWVAFPILGLYVFFIVSLALIRTAAIYHKRRRRNVTPGFNDKLSLFISACVTVSASLFLLPIFVLAVGIVIAFVTLFFSAISPIVGFVAFVVVATMGVITILQFFTAIVKPMWGDEDHSNISSRKIYFTADYDPPNGSA